MNDLGVSLHSHNTEANFREAAKKTSGEMGLAFDSRYLDPKFQPSKFDSPVIGVVRTIPRFTDPGLGAYLNDGPGGNFTGSLEDFAAGAKDRLKAHIKQHWDASRPTLHLHSSGYDSRILSSILAELRDEGFSLGTVHFRCHEPEGATFIQIMRAQGWEPDQYSVFKFPEHDLYDLGHWDRPGTAPWMPLTGLANYWRDIVPYEDEPKWNLLGGSGGGEAVEYPTDRKPRGNAWTYCANRPVDLWWSYFCDGTDFLGHTEGRFAKVMLPFFGAGHILTIGALPDRFLVREGNGCDSVRAAILRTFKVSTLDIPRFPRTRASYSFAVSPGRWAEMHANYAGSRFLREVHGAPDADRLIGEMQENFFTNNTHAVRLWRFASLWEVIKA